jgi:hypothetical protein
MVDEDKDTSQGSAASMEGVRKQMEDMKTGSGSSHDD